MPDIWCGVCNCTYRDNRTKSVMSRESGLYEKCKGQGGSGEGLSFIN